jgi:GAF domain-containing protein/tRNA A-37 threonylcarbamoyl transferase component Bud32
MALMSRAARRHARELFWRSLIALPILALLAFQALETRRSAGRRVGIVIPFGEGEPVALLELTQAGPADAAGLEVGDVVRSVGGRPIVVPLDYDRRAALFERGEPVTFVVERGGRLLAFPVAPGMPADWTPLLVNAFIVVAYLAMGLLTIARRPGSLPSDLLYRLFVLLAAELSLPMTSIGAPAVEHLSRTVFYLILALQFGTELHLVSLIPQRPDWLRRRPWLVPSYYGAGLAIGVAASATYVLDRVWELRSLPWTFDGLAELIDRGWLTFWAAALIVILVAAILRHPGTRGRVQAGLVLCGLLPWAAYVFAMQVLDWRGVLPPLWLDQYWVLCLLPYPVSIFVMLRLEDAVRIRLLRHLIEEVQQAGSVEKISRLISEKLNLAFYTKCNYVFFRGGPESELTTTHASGSDFTAERIPHDYRILEIAGRRGEPLVYPDDVDAPLPAAERDWLECLQGNLIVPLIESGRLTGLLILGQKRSEEPYTPDDLELLDSLARQIAVAHENLSLQLEIRQRERIQRQVLDRIEGQEIFLVKECPACGFCYDSSEETCPRDGAKLTLTLPVERLLDGRYRLEQVLGRGGAAVVYLATDVRLKRGVAVKVLALSLLDDVVAPRRFEREAKVAAQLLHPNIVTTHDFGETRNGLPYIVMEHLEGHSLRQLLKRHGSFDAPTVAGWFEQIFDGLGAAHALGVVHRDLKPDNVFLSRREQTGEGVVKLLDFGLAKIRSRVRDQSVTSPGTILGTLSYMAPEQLAGGDVDQRTDLYSAGVMAFEALTGRRPFDGHSPAQVLTAIVKGEFELPAGTGSLRRIFERCFQQDPARRYGSVAELRRELIPALRACPRLGPVESAA